MTQKTWVAAHTGLPCIYSSEDVTVSADGGRVLHHKGAGAPFMVADALAAPGVATRYMVGDVAHELTRTPSHAGDLLLTRLNGRGVVGLRAQPVKDILSWSSDAKIMPNGYVRKPLTIQPRAGKTIALAFTASVVEEAWELLRDRQPVVVGTGAPVPGVGIRVVQVKAVDVDWLASTGLHRVKFTWSEVVRAQLDASHAFSGAAPVLTWGEWVSTGNAWKNVTYTQLAREIAGMPA